MDRKKELRGQYKARPVIGGVCSIRCSGNNRVLLQSTVNIDGLKNRFNFALSTKTAPDPSFQKEWREFGSESFTFEVLEQIQKGELQSDKEFAADVEALYGLWLEKEM